MALLVHGISRTILIGMMIIVSVFMFSAMVIIALHYNDSDKRDVPKMQCAVPMMVMMGMVHSAMMI